MIWNNHYYLANKHAFMGASKFHWINYDSDKLIDAFIRHKSIELGTKWHEYAKMAIELGAKQPKSKKTICAYINDAIGFKMKPEQTLYYSDNCFGTADAISFRNGLLRIHDLKTGTNPAHMEQLMVYAALFCLEYKMKPGAIKMELRIYQNDEVRIFEPTAEEILPIMSKIKQYSKLIDDVKKKAEE